MIECDSSPIHSGTGLTATNAKTLAHVHGKHMIVGLGTDIVEIERVRDMIDRHGDSFLERCFTKPEITYAHRHRDSAVRFAGRWAAKEAVVKVLGTGFVKGISFHDIEVLPLDSGQPRIVLTGGAASFARQMNIGAVLVTISHAKLYATATAIGMVSMNGEASVVHIPDA